MYNLVRIYNENHQVIAEASMQIIETKFIVREFYDGLSYEVIG